ncbi:MAG: SRPBCC family protein [Longimicrobiales bacterium]
MRAEVTVEMTIAAPRELVFLYFTDPTRIRAWLGEGSTLDARIGGPVMVRYPQGEVAVGKVERVEAPNLIEFSWGYQDDSHGLAPGASRVTIELKADGEGTRVRLRHSGLDAAQQEGQGAGWRYQLSRLTGLVLDETLGANAPRIVDTYFRAWNEPDAARRAELLEQCCAADASFRDAMSIVQGRTELSDLIGVAHAISQGARLEPEGALQHCKGAVTFGWKIVGPSDWLMARGVNFGELTAAGKLRNIVGFWHP